MTQDPNAMPGTASTPAGPPPGSMGYETPPAGPIGYETPPAGPIGYETPPQGPIGYTPPPAPPKRSNRTVLIIIGVLALIVVAVIAYVALTRDSSTGGVDALQVGDCIDQPAGASTITQVQHQPCTKPHDGEVFALLTNPAAADEPYPVVSGFDDYIQTNCIPLWEAYTGRTWSTDTELDLNYLHPTLLGWGNGDRGFTCYLTRLDSAKLNASVKRIGASPLP